MVRKSTCTAQHTQGGESQAELCLAPPLDHTAINPLRCGVVAMPSLWCGCK